MKVRKQEFIIYKKLCLLVADAAITEMLKDTTIVIQKNEAKF